MPEWFTSVRQMLHACSAAALVVLPTIVALDRGGVLAWDRWAVAIAAVLLVLTSGFGESTWDLRGHGLSPRKGLKYAVVQWAPTLLLLAIVVLALVQSFELPADWVRRLAPASSDAFTQWLPAATGIESPESHPITVGADLTTGYAIRMLAVAALAYCATLVFSNRELIPVLLVGLVGMALVHSAAGFYQQQNTPGIALFINERIGGPFGTFVNRNSAGGLLLVGLSTAIGLLIFRVNLLSGIVREEFEQAAKARAAREKRARKKAERREKEAKAKSSQSSGTSRVRYYKPPAMSDGESPTDLKRNSGESPSSPLQGQTPSSTKKDRSLNQASQQRQAEQPNSPVRKILSAADFPLSSHAQTPPASWLPKSATPGALRGNPTSVPPGFSGPPGVAGPRPQPYAQRPDPTRQTQKRPTREEIPEDPSEDFLGTTSPLKRTADRLARDPLTIYAAVGIFVTIAAIFASGSRGAVVGGLCGFIACLTAAIPVNRIFRWLVAGFFVFFIVVTSLDQLGIAATALDRLEVSQAEGIENDGRFTHWPDALQATMNYLPMGAGMGAYRYAYLPFQETGMGTWCINADNQWLELVLEGGLPAVLILLAALIAATVALIWLVDSEEAVDRGLAVAGVFALVALLVAESFDFALMMLGPASAAALLAGAISGRAILCRMKAQLKDAQRDEWGENRSIGEHEEPSTLDKTAVRIWRQLCSGARWSTPVFLLIFLGMAIPVAREQAASEAVWIATNDLLNQPSSSRETLEAMDAALLERCKAEPQNHRMYSARALVQSAIFRLSEAEEFALTARPRLTAEQQLRQFSLPSVRRRAFAQLPLQWETQPAEDEVVGISQRFGAVGTVWLPTQESASLPRYVPLSGESLGNLQVAAEMARKSLELAPLSDTGRWVLVRTDFAVSDARRTPILLKQLGVLRERTAESQMEVAQAAIDISAMEQVKESLRQAVSVSGGVLSRVMEVVTAYDGRIQPSEVIPADSRELTLAAIQWQLRRKEQELDPELKRLAMEYLDLPISSEERSLKEKLLKSNE